MEKRDLKWEMDEFWQKVGSIAPTLLLVEMRDRTGCGGVAGVPWPPLDTDAKDPSKTSCVFSLGATPTRFDLVRADSPAIHSWDCGFAFGSFLGGSELAVYGNGWGCVACGRKGYAGAAGPWLADRHVSVESGPVRAVGALALVR
jgi:hypothetical protein